MAIIERNTIQRTLVMEAVNSLANHPTADEIYNYVEKQYPNISKATVYRNLNGLSSDGLISRVHMPSGADRFDHKIDEHCHITCVECGNFADVGTEYDEEIDAKAQADTGYSQPHHDMFFTGLCPECAKRKK